MWNPLDSLGGHLGADVSALVDGQLGHAESERAWNHVLHCPACRRLVEREGWVKRQVTSMGARPLEAERPPERLLGSLYDLRPLETSSPSVQESWAAVEALEARGRTRRRAGIALVGAGSVSAAVLGISALGGAPLGIGGSTPAPATSLSRGAATAAPTRAVLSPAATVHGRLPGWIASQGSDGVTRATAVSDDRR
ncbi:MAG: anti-sigma factor family protein [Nocardioides sp.]